MDVGQYKIRILFISIFGIIVYLAIEFYLSFSFFFESPELKQGLEAQTYISSKHPSLNKLNPEYLFYLKDGFQDPKYIYAIKCSLDKAKSHFQYLARGNKVTYSQELIPHENFIKLASDSNLSNLKESKYWPIKGSSVNCFLKFNNGVNHEVTFSYSQGVAYYIEFIWI